MIEKKFNNKLKRNGKHMKIEYVKLKDKELSKFNAIISNFKNSLKIINYVFYNEIKIEVKVKINTHKLYKNTLNRIEKNKIMTELVELQIIYKEINKTKSQ